MHKGLFEYLIGTLKRSTPFAHTFLSFKFIVNGVSEQKSFALSSLSFPERVSKIAFCDSKHGATAAMLAF